MNLSGSFSPRGASIRYLSRATCRWAFCRRLRIQDPSTYSSPHCAIPFSLLGAGPSVVKCEDFEKLLSLPASPVAEARREDDAAPEGVRAAAVATAHVIDHVLIKINTDSLLLLAHPPLPPVLDGDEAEHNQLLEQNQ